jgi:hypothetical protein
MGTKPGISNNCIYGLGRGKKEKKKKETSNKWVCERREISPSYELGSLAPRNLETMPQGI